MNWSTRALHDTPHFEARIDRSSILAYVVHQVLVSDQSDCMIITCESHMRMGVGESDRQWVEAIGVANVRRTEL